MTDLEISKALALAIGYLPEHVILDVNHAGGPYIMVFRPESQWVLDRPCNYERAWRVFDCRDWDVIGPIAAKHNCFPTLMGYGLWSASIAFGKIYDEDTPQKAIALAVIQGEKK